MNTEEVLVQICQIKEKYESQVTGPHKRWPRAIKERVAELYRSGMKVRTISERSGISYHTVSSWTARISVSKFKQLTVQANSKRLPAPQTLRRPVGRPKTIVHNGRNGSVTMKTPDGIIVEGLNLEDVAVLLLRLRGR